LIHFYKRFNYLNPARTDVCIKEVYNRGGTNSK